MTDTGTAKLSCVKFRLSNGAPCEFDAVPTSVRSIENKATKTAVAMCFSTIVLALKQGAHDTACHALLVGLLSMSPFAYLHSFPCLPSTRLQTTGGMPSVNAP